METHLIASSTKFRDGFGCWTHENVSTWPQAPVKAAVKVAKAPKALCLSGYSSGNPSVSLGVALCSL